MTDHAVPDDGPDPGSRVRRREFIRGVAGGSLAGGARPRDLNAVGPAGADRRGETLDGGNRTAGSPLDEDRRGVPPAARTVTVAATATMLATLGLAYVLLHFGGENPEG